MRLLTTLDAGSSIYGATSASVNGPIKSQFGVLAGSGFGSTITPASAPLRIHSINDATTLYSFDNAGNFSTGTVVTTGTVSGPFGTLTAVNSPAAAKHIPPSTGGHLFTNAANSTNVLTLSDAGNLAVTGTATKPGGGLWAAASDERTKQSIAPHVDGLAHIRALRPIVYEYNGKGATIADGKRYVGLSAQAVRGILPRAVITTPGKLNPTDEQETDLLSLDATELIYTLVNAVQDLAAQVEAIKAAVQPGRKQSRGFFARLFTSYERATMF